jgi:cell wall-associated NlpC family hydrolase
MKAESGKSESGNLLTIARRWLGTPWCANSFCCGLRGGVSCHNLPREIYIEAGILASDFPRIAGDPRGATANNEMEIFLDQRPEFVRIELSAAQPGDLIGLFIPIDAVGHRVRERCVNHLAVMLPGNEFIHVLVYGATRVDQINVPPWQQRLIAVWRPL